MTLFSVYVLFSPDPGGEPVFPGSDKVVHLGLFALLAGTARWRFGRRRTVLAAVIGYAALSELVQAVALTRRSGDVLDLVADVIGGLLGWLIAQRLLRRH